MDVLDTSVVGLCIDPAHLQVNGSDPVDVVRTYGDHVDYVHFKDATVGEERLHGFDRYKAFAPLGEGTVDFVSLTDALLDLAYGGPVIVELDRPAIGTAEASCLKSVAYLRDTLGLALTPAERESR